MEIRPIRDDEAYQEALATISSLWASVPGSAEYDTLDVLTTLVEAYEREHFPIAPPHPVDAIKFRLEQQELTRKDLERYIGSRSKVSEVLAGKRRLSLPMIRRLLALGIPADSLVQPLAAGSTVRRASKHARKAPDKRPQPTKPAAASASSTQPRQPRTQVTVKAPRSARSHPP